MKSLNLKKIIIPVLGLGLVASCSPKMTPPVGKANPPANEIPIKMENQTNTEERLALGKTIFDNSCGKCHDLPNPTDHSAQDWVGIMNWMAPKARLTEEQHATVYDYVVSVKK